jgi:hypothetical protein
MMFQVYHIIINQPQQRNRFNATRITFSQEVVLGYVADDLQQVQVVYVPEVDQVFGIQLLVITALIPFILVVPDKRRFFKLNADKSLVVIGSTVYQVTQYLFFAPFSRRRRLKKRCLRYLVQQWRNSFAKMLEPLQGFFYHKKGLNCLNAATVCLSNHRH